MKMLIGLILIVLVVPLTGCVSRIAFGHKTHRLGYKLADAEIKKLQFFIDVHIVLRREMSSGKQVTGDHIIRTEDGKFIEVIIIRKGTPCVATGVTPEVIYVSFEEGSLALAFKVDDRSRVEKLFGHKIVPYRDSYDLVADATNHLRYRGHSYQVEVNGRHWPTLMVGRKAIKKPEKKTEVLRGRKFGGSKP